MSNEYSRQELVSALEKAAQEIIPLTSGAFDRHPNYPAKSTIKREFGSWTKACKIVGVESGQVTEKSILQNIKKLYSFNEIENSEDFFQHSDTVSPATFYKYFDDWRTAVDKIELGAYTHYSNDDLLELIKEFENEYGYVSQRKFKYDDNYPSSTTVNRRWGSWNNAVEAADIESNEIGIAADEEPCGLKQELFGSNWNTQRERALERDSYECKECASETNLSVHHDKPRVSYRESNVFEIEEANTMDNLITLCEDCHHSVHSGNTTVDTPYPDNLQPRLV
jgi:hypothetical protein